MSLWPSPLFQSRSSTSKHILSEAGLGRHRWVVERTLGWLSKYRRLTIRYE